MASSSSTNCWKHDVFLNFRGQDTRNTFTSHLHQALCNKGVHVYIDDELERGKAIAPALLQAIEQSRISIVVFSETYACSSYCLDELVKMLECKESKGQVVLPVFYNVDPSDVEAQNDSFGEPVLRAASMAAASMDKLLEWKEALTKAARLSGWHLDNGNEAKTIQSIVEKVLAILNRAFLHVADHPVGLDSHIQDLNCQLRLASNDVCMVGILGIGGIGKTTVAKAIYNEIANQFEGSSFLANVREMAKQNKVVELQQTLLSQILGEKNCSVGNIDFGISVIKDRLCSKKVLIVVDDVDNVDQLKTLAGEPDWFGAGSRIIITSRDEHVLVSHGVKFVHRVQELCRGDAFQLFSWHAFRNSQPKEEFMMHSREAVTYAQGLPLALVVLGSFLYGRSVHEWESQLDKLKQIPDKKIYEILKISYDGLEDGTQKAIFLDIACFFRGMDKDYVMKVFHACDFKPIIGLQVLIEKSLISIENNKLQMHDLLQLMGRQIVQQESPNIPGRRSRLWFHEDIAHVLTENMGTDEIEAIMLDFHEPEEMHLSAKAFKKMKRLRILIIRNALLTMAPVYLSNELRWLEWPGCPLLSLPSTFHARKLVVLNMQHSFISHFEGFKNYSCLKFMNFSGCESLKETPDFSTIRNLERLNLEGCANLVEVHQSVGYLDKLEFLNVEFCSNLRSLPRRIKLKSLNTLLLSGCQKLEAFPDVVEKMPCLEKLRLSRTAIEVLPSSIKNISGLKVLTLTFCKNLADLPISIYKLTHLESLFLECCSKLDKFPVNGENEVPSNFLTSSNCYENSSGLDFLQANSLEGSSSLGFPSLRLLDLRNCCLRNVNFLKMHDCFPMLKELDLSGNSFAIFPETLSLFTHLKSLRLHKCKKLQEIPELPRNIKRLEARDCELLERYSPLEKEGEWPAKLRVVDFSNCHKLAKNQGKNLEDAFFSKVFHKQFQVEMFLPGSKIPEWFTVTGEQGSLTYLVPSSVFEKIQGLVICSILCLEDGVTANISCEMFVDGKSMILCSRHFFPLETDHMWLYYQPYCYTRALGKAINDLVRFEISFEVLGAPRGSALKMCGIYFIYTQDKTVSDPSSTQSTSYHTEHSVSFDLMTSHYVVDPGLALRRRMNRKRPVSSDLTERCLELSLNPKVSRRKIADDQRRKPFSLSLPSADQRRKRFSLSLPSADQRRKRFSLSLPSADQPASSDLTEGCYNVDLELRLNPKVSRRKTADDQKPGNPLTASKSGEHQLEHWLSLSLQPMDVSNWDPCSTQSTSYYTEHSVSFDLITSHYVVDPGLALSPSMNRKRPASSDLTEGCYNVDLELSLNPKVSRRKTADDQRGEQFSLSLQSANQKPGNPLTASKSGEHQLEHWLSLSLQPMDVSNRDPMCIKKLEEKVPFQPKCKEKMNFFNELGRILLPAEEGEEEEDGGSNSN